LDVLEQRLSQSAFLGGEKADLSDIALFPFVRQFAAVDVNWFDASPYPATRKWLRGWVESELFKKIMAKLSVQ
jgi:glutathione S-transferase